MQDKQGDFILQNSNKLSTKCWVQEPKTIKRQEGCLAVCIVMIQSYFLLKPAFKIPRENRQLNLKPFDGCTIIMNKASVQ